MTTVGLSIEELSPDDAARRWPQMSFRDVRSGDLKLSNLLLVMAYLGKLYDPIKTLGRQRMRQ